METSVIDHVQPFWSSTSWPSRKWLEAASSASSSSSHSISNEISPPSSSTSWLRQYEESSNSLTPSSCTPSKSPRENSPSTVVAIPNVTCTLNRGIATAPFVSCPTVP